MTALQRAALDFICAYHAARGLAPSYEEIRRALGLSHRSRVHGLVASLETQGALTRVPGHPRSLRPVAAVEGLARRMLANALESCPQGGWVKLRASDVAALERALTKPRQPRQ